MIVPGIVISNAWWIGGGSDNTTKMAPMGTTPKATTPTVSEGPISGQVVTTAVTAPEESGWFGRPGPAQRSENRQRMWNESVDAFGKYGSVAATLLFSPNPIMKTWAVFQLIGIETQSEYAN